MCYDSITRCLLSRSAKTSIWSLEGSGSLPSPVCRKLSGIPFWDRGLTGSIMRLRNSKDIAHNTHAYSGKRYKWKEKCMVQPSSIGYKTRLDHAYATLTAKSRSQKDSVMRESRVHSGDKADPSIAQYHGKSRRKGRRRKGSRKKHTFPLGHKYYRVAMLKASNDDNQLHEPVHRVIKRLDHERFQRVVVQNKFGLLEVPGPSKEPGSAMILRPKKKEPEKEVKPSFDCEESNFILEKNRTEELLSHAISEHNKLGLDHDFQVEFSDIQPRGTGFIRSCIKCKQCGFQTKSKPLYAEIERQPNQK